jgi:hypothetical protein
LSLFFSKIAKLQGEVAKATELLEELAHAGGVFRGRGGKTVEGVKVGKE